MFGESPISRGDKPFLPFLPTPEMARVLIFAAATASGLTTLYDVPVSNHGARVRLLLYKKGLESAVNIVSPQVCQPG